MSEIPVGSSPADAYRAVMRHWPSGVTVVTMPVGDTAHGMTASAFTSVSIEPPMILVVVDRRWRSHEFIAQAGAFCVNILADDQSSRADLFAGRHGPVDRFAETPVTTAATGSPVLTDGLAFLDCRVVHAHPAGDHTVFVGEVLACGVPRPDAAPLLYYNQHYARIA